MADRQQTRPAFSDITNTINLARQTDEETRKREERNRKQREYRARKRTEETTEQREERNRKQREYRARKKTPAISTTPVHEPCDVQPISGCTNVNMTEAVESTLAQSQTVEVQVTKGKSQQQTIVSAISQASVYCDKENAPPIEESDRLHRNDDYVRRQRPSLMPVPSESPNGTVINTGSSLSTNKLRSWQSWYLNLDATTKTNLLQQRRDYKKAIATKNHHQDLTHMPVTPVQPRFVSSNDEVEFDNALFEPRDNYSDDEDHLRDIEESFAIEEDGPKGFETMHNLGEVCAFQSYRVNNDYIGNAAADDPYDFVYHNLPEQHHVLKKVSDCGYCGAMRFEGEALGFCCRKGKINVHINDVPAELKRLFTSQVDSDTKYFRKHIRYFNSHFSFMSLGVTLDRRYCSATGTGIYTFRVHGTMYHRLDHLVPGSKGPRHLQLYFYDTEEDDTLSHRVKRSPDLDINIVRNVLRILQENNPYVQKWDGERLLINMASKIL